MLQNYAVTLAEQLGKHATHNALGLRLTESQLDELRDDQVGQLFELFQEIQRPSSAAAGDEDGTKPDRQTAAEAGTKPPPDDTVDGSASVANRNDKAGFEDCARSHKVGS